jgi:hypothetical protein
VILSRDAEPAVDDPDLHVVAVPAGTEEGLLIGPLVGGQQGVPMNCGATTFTTDDPFPRVLTSLRFIRFLDALAWSIALPA